MRRRWSCREMYDGYLIVLSCGDIYFSVLVSKKDLDTAIDKDRYLQYHFFRLNESMKRAVFPLTKSISDYRREKF